VERGDLSLFSRIVAKVKDANISPSLAGLCLEIC